MPEPEVDLGSLFESVAKALKSNQSTLNKADAYNHDHGDNMVRNFRVISRALKKRPGAPPSEQLAIASDALRKSSITGSARMYAQGLSAASTKLQGERSVNSENAFGMVQALMGGTSVATTPKPKPKPSSQQPDLLGNLVGSLISGEPSAPAKPDSGDQATDLLGSLMGSLMGAAGENGQPQQPASGEGQPDLLGSLMGSMMGAAGEGGQTQEQAAGEGVPDLLGSVMGSLASGGQAEQPAAAQAESSQGGDGLDIGDIITMGMAYLQAKDQGAEPLEALIQAVMAGSQMNDTPHHSQSGQIVAGTLINTLSSMLKQ